MAITLPGPHPLRQRPEARDVPSGRADEVAAAVFSTWVVIGLFVDGWAHNADKPESFWTPWHAILYSGFAAGMAWFAVGEWHKRRLGIETPPDRLTLLGFGLFAAGGLVDMAWHSIFGVEQDLEALLSPSHLLLMGAGLLLVSFPIRSALDQPDPPHTLRTFAPAAAGLALAVAVVAFFTQFESALHLPDHDAFAADASDELQVHGVVGVLLSSTLLVGALVWARGRWLRPPPGTFTLVFGGTALLMAGLDGFDQLVLVVPVVGAGALSDVLVAGRLPTPVVAVVVPAAMWTGWFAVYHAGWGLGWSAELSTGTVVLSSLAGYGLSLLPTARPAHEVDDGSLDDQR